MVFSSHIFLYWFLPLSLALYYLSLPVSRRVWRGATSLLLCVASFVFYGWNRPAGCLLMLGSAALDYVCGREVARAQGRGGSGLGWLWCSLVGNLGLLGYFKYANFGVESWNALVAALGAPDAAVADWKRVPLPVGISFFTFQTMSYTIDVWRRQVAPARSCVDFLAYVTMYPQLVAGPIVRYADVADQLEERAHPPGRLLHGVLLFQLGLAKKLLIADTLGRVVEQCFAADRFDGSPLGPLGAAEAWIGAVAFVFQMYFDFSGYSDMAIGLGKLTGFTFPTNFDAPFSATTLTEFRRRWHISLATWLRDYLYFPLGGNRRGPVRADVNLALTMTLSGLWHGANWTFVVWGTYQGLIMVLERHAPGRSLYPFLPKPLRAVATFAVVAVGMTIFKAPDLGYAADYVGALFGAHGIGSSTLDLRASHGVAFLAAVVATWALPTSQRAVAAGGPLTALAVQPFFVWALCRLHGSHHVPFLYFAF